MGWTHYLFGFRGRLNRAKYWLFVLIYTVSLTVVMGVGGAFMLTGAVQGGLAGAAAGGWCSCFSLSEFSPSGRRPAPKSNGAA
jgi:uncharacterized membrane protein YhaH (DUF805 family)